MSGMYRCVHCHKEKGAADGCRCVSVFARRDDRAEELTLYEALMKIGASVNRFTDVFWKWLFVPPD